MSKFRLSNKKKGLALVSGLALVLVCSGLTFYVQPKLAAESMGKMALAHNYAAITQNIDYPALKVNMANNLLRIIRQNNRAHHLHLNMKLMQAAANNGAAHMATPSGVTALLAHTLPALGQHVNIVRYTGKFLGPHRYAILATGATGGHLGVIFYRQGLLTWKLGDIQMFPPHMPLNAYPAPVTTAEVQQRAPTITAIPVVPPVSGEKKR